MIDELTLNLGLRYDLTHERLGQRRRFLPFLGGGRPDDTNNIQPRVGFA